MEGSWFRVEDGGWLLWVGGSCAMVTGARAQEKHLSQKGFAMWRCIVSNLTRELKPAVTKEMQHQGRSCCQPYDNGVPGRYWRYQDFGTTITEAELALKTIAPVLPAQFVEVRCFRRRCSLLRVLLGVVSVVG